MADEAWNGWKIFDLYWDATRGMVLPRTLFHGVHHCRALQLDEWIQAEKRMVTDGSRQQKYLSGFHVYPTIDAAKQWAKRAKRHFERAVCRVRAIGDRTKPRAVRPVRLADALYITSEDWEARTPLAQLVEEQ